MQPVERDQVGPTEEPAAAHDDCAMKDQGGSREVPELSGVDVTLLVGVTTLVPWVSFVGDRWLDYCFPAAAALMWSLAFRGGMTWGRYFAAIPRILAAATLALMIATGFAAARVIDQVDFLDQVRLILLPGVIYLCLYTVIVMALMRDWPFMKSLIRAVYVGIAIGCLLFAAESFSGGAFGRTIIAELIDDEFAPAYFNRAEMMLSILAWTTTPVIAARYGAASGIAVPALVWVLSMFGESELVQAGMPVSVALYLLALRSPKLACDSAFAAALLALLAAPLVYPLVFEIAPTLPVLSSTKFLVRAEIWDAVSRFALDAPITGHGLHATRHAGPVPIANIYYPQAPIWHPHNGFLQIWADLGLIGVACVGVVIASAWKAVRGLSPRATPTVVAAFTLIVLAVISTHAIWSTWWLGFTALTAGYVTVVAGSIDAGTTPTAASGGDRAG